MLITTELQIIWSLTLSALFADSMQKSVMGIVLCCPVTIQYLHQSIHQLGHDVNLK